VRTHVVVAHPDEQSLTRAVADRLVDALSDDGHDVDVADLHAEGFDPRFTLADRRRYRAEGPLPDDIAAEQRRIDRADHLVLLFPVYWWSMPAMLKGWVDRVFVNGWAFDDTTTPMTRKLGSLTVHLVMVGGEDAAGYRKRGYDSAIDTQMRVGIIGYCGARAGASEYVFDAESRPRAEVARDVTAAVEAVSTAVRTARRDTAGQPV
jgi:NAD(P)H dehydrogenase (quinone)